MRAALASSRNQHGVEGCGLQMVKIVVKKKKKNPSNPVIPLLPVSLDGKSRSQTVPAACWGRNKRAARGGLRTEQIPVGEAVAELTLPGAQGWGWDEPPGCLCLLLCGLLGCQATELSWSMDFSTSLRFKQLFLQLWVLLR